MTKNNVEEQLGGYEEVAEAILTERMCNREAKDETVAHAAIEAYKRSPEMVALVEAVLEVAEDLEGGADNYLADRLLSALAPFTEGK